MAKKLYKYDSYYGRMGSLDGIFIADEEEVERLKGYSARFGEVLGKHSYITDDSWFDNTEVLTNDQDFIAKFIEIMGDGTISGYNPMDYIDEDEEDEA